MSTNHNPSPAVFAASAPAGSFDPTTTLGDPLHYSHDEYRWVPVRRVPRYDGWTEEKQRRFIEVLADTGQVRLACEAVRLSRESAYKLRRAPGGDAFAAAWDAARLHAVHAIEDVAFERAIEGTAHTVFNSDGEPTGERRHYNDRLLMFLLRHLKPEAYGPDAQAAPPPMAKILRTLEPALPAPPEVMLDADTLEHELLLADIAEGELPHFLSEQRRDIDTWHDPLTPEERADFEARLERAKLGLE
jgi:hypothetical protein